MGLKSGNEILKKFAALLQSNYPGMIVCRYGDDRFIVYDEYNDNNVNTRIDTVIAKLESLDPNYTLKVKVGIYVPLLTEEPASWVDYAQLACQEIKNDLNVNIKVFDEQLKNKLIKKNYIIDNIDKALENNWVKVYFQPVIGTKENKLVAMEALTRWIDPVYGFLSPADFISVLEENNLIYKIDTFVINKVCERLSNELKENHQIVPISINLSRVDFITCQPFDEVEKAIKKYNIDRKYICIEITESVAMDDPKLLTKAINQFRNAGYEVWMDDFGSGYSSLNVLKDYPFDEIKIDMAFLKNFNDKAKVIISSTIAMAKKLNIRTLTEGVETKEHFDFLKDVGCERIQGYYFSKPLPYDEVIDLMKSKNLF
jgi:EAL domain-containing protein (putative c-di-GMP-specific phosphodiesterase class I)